MAYPNTLIFVDFPADDTKAAANFYSKVFRWKVEGRPAGFFGLKSCAPARPMGSLKWPRAARKTL